MTKVSHHHHHHHYYNYLNAPLQQDIYDTFKLLLTAQPLKHLQLDSGYRQL